jgi:hypothetical protein
MLILQTISFFLILVPAKATNETATVDNQVGWQGSLSQRGTWDLILSCATTIVACTWSVQYLNLPALSEADKTIRKFLRTSKWMIITILFPEFILAHAIFELMMAIEATNKVSQSIDRKVAKYPRIIRLFLPKKAQGGRKEDYLNEQVTPY